MAKSSPSIRKAEIDDAAALATCIDLAYAKYAGRLSDLPDVSSGCAEDILENQVWVAVEQGEIVGGLVLVVRESSMKIANVAVHPDHSGKGIGRSLITLACDEAKKQELAEIRLNTHSAMTDNLRFYTHLGFVETSSNGNTITMGKPIKQN